MKLLSLEALHASMTSISTEEAPIDLQQFRSIHGAVEFDCLFSVRGRPYSIAMTSRGSSPEFFLFPVSINYEISNAIPVEDFRRLTKVLRTTGVSKNRLVPRDFFTEMNEQIPTKAKKALVPSPDEIMRLRQDIREERNSPFFSHWRHPGHYPNGSPYKISEENKKKTLELLGTEALKHSLTAHVSSCWSPIFVKKGWEP